jgi:hypothetical protein
MEQLSSEPLSHRIECRKFIGDLTLAAFEYKSNRQEFPPFPHPRTINDLEKYTTRPNVTISSLRNTHTVTNLGLDDYATGFHEWIQFRLGEGSIQTPGTYTFKTTQEGMIWNNYSDIGIFDQNNFTQYTRKLIIGRINSTYTDRNFTLISRYMFEKNGFPILTSIHPRLLTFKPSLKDPVSFNANGNRLFFVFPSKNELPKSEKYEVQIVGGGEGMEYLIKTEFESRRFPYTITYESLSPALR